MSGEEGTEATRYWRTNLKLVGGLLVVWFLVSYGAAILFVEPLNTIPLGGFPLGFWFARGPLPRALPSLFPRAGFLPKALLLLPLCMSAPPVALHRFLGLC